MDIRSINYLICLVFGVSKVRFKNGVGFSINGSLNLAVGNIIFVRNTVFYWFRDFAIA